MTIKRIFSSVIIFLITFSCSPPASLEVDKSWAEQTLQELSLREKISQMLIYSMHLSFRNNDNGQWQEINELIASDGIGGIHLWSGNSGLSVTMLNELQRKSKIPILVDMDIERGLQQRFSEGTQIPPAMAISATANPKYAFDAGRITAIEARSSGIHLNLAPVVDVHNNPDNPIINTRSFSDDPQYVADNAVQYINGLKSGGMLTTAKHYPGHGDSQVDSHKSLAVIRSDSLRLVSIELAPYQKIIDAGVDAVMVSHLTAPDYQSNANTPATFSKFWIQDILRGKLGFDGAIITDAMDMGAITDGFSDDYALINAVNAGCDIIIQNHNYRKALDVIENAVIHGFIEQSRIDEAAHQMLKLKEKSGLHLSKISDFKTIQKNVGLAESHQIAGKIARESITLVKNDRNLVPLGDINGDTLVIIDIYGTPYNHSISLVSNKLLKKYLSSNYFVIDESDSLEYLQIIADQIKENSTIILNIFAKPKAHKGTVTLNEVQNVFINLLMGKSINIVMNSFGNPYLIRDFPDISTYLCAWESQSILQTAAVDAILGNEGIVGKLPIKISDIAERGSGIILKKSPYYFKSNPKVVLPKLQTVMSYEIGVNNSKILKLLERAVADSAFPGGVLLAAKQGKIFVHEAFGYNSYAKEKVNGKGTIFDIASITKVIATTSAVMKLHDDGKIDLNESIGKYIPEFIDEKLPDVKSRKLVTIKHLLLHNSGLPQSIALYKIDGDDSTIIDSLYHTRLVYQPGKKTYYSDVGFIFLGKIIERISGVGLDEYVNQNIFIPLGMNDTYFNPSANKKKRIIPTELNNETGSYMRGFVHDENAFCLGGISGNAGLFSTADDMAIFSQMMLNKGIYNGETVFRDETIDLFTTPNNINESSRCLGWDSPNGLASGGVYLSDSSYGHTGFTGTSLWIDPENDIFVILLTNAVHPNREWKDPKYYDWRQRIHSAVYEALGFTEMNPRLNWRKAWNAE